jgi:DNA-binding protein YbaB
VIPLNQRHDMLTPLIQLSQELNEAVQVVTAAHESDRQFAGTDQSGAVTVTVDGRGRTTSVVVDEEWHSALAVTELSEAVLAASAAAMLARVDDFDQAMLDAPLGDGQAARPTTTDGGPALPANVYSIDDAALRPLMRDINTYIDQMANSVEAALRRTCAGTSRARHVEVTLAGHATLAGIRFDQRWLVNAHVHNIAQETREALLAAYRQMGDDPVRELVDPGTALSRLMELAQSPPEAGPIR